MPWDSLLHNRALKHLSQSPQQHVFPKCLRQLLKNMLSSPSVSSALAPTCPSLCLQDPSHSIFHQLIRS